MEPYFESNDDLIMRAAAAGFAITRQDLVRTLRSGLIPPPRQFAHGRGQGSTVRYRAGTADQLVLVLTLREGRRRPLAYLRWGTWWNGGAIDERWIRRELRLAAGRVLRDREAMLAAVDTTDAGDEARARLERTSANAIRRLPAKFRADFRAVNSSPLITMGLQLFEGTPPDPLSIGEALDGLESRPVLPTEQALLSTLSAALRHADFVALASAVPIHVLQQLRDELRVVAGILFGQPPSTDGLSPRQARLMKQALAVTKLLIASPDALLLWIVARSTGQAGDVLLTALRKMAAERGIPGPAA